MLKQGMSNDRVEFILPMRYRTRNANKDAYIEVVMVQLGLTLAEAEQAISAGQRIRCRPSQFARFIIARDAAGYENDMKGLNMKLISKSDSPKLLNFVSTGKPSTSAKCFILRIFNGQNLQVRAAMIEAMGRNSAKIRGLELFNECIKVVMYKSHFAYFIEELWKRGLLDTISIAEGSIAQILGDDGVLDVSDRAWS